MIEVAWVIEALRAAATTILAEAYEYNKPIPAQYTKEQRAITAKALKDQAEEIRAIIREIEKGEIKPCP